MRIAVYAGSFDPPHHGHLDLILRAARLVDRLHVSIGVHPSRKPLFSVEERQSLLRQLTAPLGGSVVVDAFHGLLVDHCRTLGAGLIVRGLRVGADFDYELPIAQANADMAPEVETLFLATRPGQSFVSGSIVREIASHGGDVSRYVEPPVAEALRARFVKPPAGG